MKFDKKDFYSLENLEFSLFRHKHEMREYPNWMLRHFQTLTEKEQRAYFREFRHVTDQMYKEDYLVDCLKWILKYSPMDLEYDFYIQAKLDLDFYYPDIFKPGKWPELEKKYCDRFNEDVLSVLESQANQVSPPNDSEDTLPF